jgi:hypothetical protein
MSAIRALAARRTPFVFTQRAAFSQSIARCAGKESALRTSTPRVELQLQLQDQLINAQSVLADAI